MFIKKIFAVLLMLALPLVALADQAAYITKTQAEKTAKFLLDKKQIKHYCQPCEDKSIRLEEIGEVAAVAAGYQDFWEVRVNGEGIDLAYVYFQTEKGKWKNLAKELGVKADDVPTFLPEEKSGEKSEK